MESSPLHCQWLEKYGHLNKRKCGAKVGRELGIVLRLLKHRYNFYSPSVPCVDAKGLAGVMGFAVLLVSEVLHHWKITPSEAGLLSLGSHACPGRSYSLGFGALSPFCPPHFFEKTFPYFVIDIFCAIFFFLGVRWGPLAYPFHLPQWLCGTRVKSFCEKSFFSQWTPIHFTDLAKMFRSYLFQFLFFYPHS